MSEAEDNKVKEPVDPASDHYREIINTGLEHMTEAAKEINGFVAQRKRVVPEGFFINMLLPIIRAHIRQEHPVELGYWLNVADGMHNTIDVHDDKDPAKILFTVPPAFNNLPDRDKKPETGKRFGTIAQLVSAQADMLDNGDTRGSMAIDSELNAICAPRPEDDEKTKNLLLLVEIYERYELPLEELLGSAADEIRQLLRKRDGKVVQGTTNDGDDEEPPLLY